MLFVFFSNLKIMVIEMLRTHLINITAYSGMLVAWCATIDYNRKISHSNNNCSYITPKNILANNLNLLHKAALNNNLKYCNIIENQNMCIELHNLFMVALKKHNSILFDKELIDNTNMGDLQSRKAAQQITDFPEKAPSRSEESYHQKMTPEDIKEMVVRHNTNLTMQMCRRAMLRNGFFVMWFKTFVERSQYCINTHF